MAEMTMASNAKGNLGVTLGAIGTGLSILNGGAGLLNLGGMPPARSGDDAYVTRHELGMAQALAAKDSEIALLKSEQNTEIKIADVYERVMTRVNQDQRDQMAINTQQAVYNATNNSMIGCMQAQVAALNAMTKMVIPADNVCPQPMARYNSWTAPTTVTTTEPVVNG